MADDTTSVLFLSQWICGVGRPLNVQLRHNQLPSDTSVSCNCCMKLGFSMSTTHQPCLSHRTVTIYKKTISKMTLHNDWHAIHPQQSMIPSQNKKNNIRYLRIHDVLVIPPKTGPIHGSNFIKSWPIFKIISPLEILVNLKQDAQLSQRDRAAGYISFGRKWKTGTQRQYFTDIVSLSSTTVT